MKVVFLSLKGFAGIGGIEKVNRLVMRVLTDLKEMRQIGDFRALSAYDETCDTRYIPSAAFVGFGGNRIAFSLAAVRAGISADVVILSHINLAPVVLAIKALRPRVKLLLIAHGIEIWPRQSAIKKALMMRCERMLAISHFTKNKVIEVNGIPASGVEVLHNSIDPFLKIPQRFEKPEHLLRRYGLQFDDQILITVTRMSTFEKFKGYDRVIESVARLKFQFPRIKYLLAGKCDEAERQRLTQMIQSLGLQNQVILTGFVKEEELTDHFLLGDIFVMPSKKEGFGIVFIEALACGMTVIAGNKDGSVDAIRNGTWGLLTDPDDTDEIRETIVKGLNSIGQVTQEDKKRKSEEVINTFGFQAYRSNWQRILRNATPSHHP
jgi:glycosyltransferase involved in cell wall biosynthesis